MSEEQNPFDPPPREGDTNGNTENHMTNEVLMTETVPESEQIVKEESLSSNERENAREEGEEEHTSENEPVFRPYSDDLSDISDEDVRMGFLYAPHAFVGTDDACIFHFIIVGTGPNNDEETKVTVYVHDAGVKCVAGHHDESQCSVSASKQTMLNILHGHTSITMTIMCGELSVSDPAKMFSFGNAFKFVREDFFKFRDDYYKTEKQGVAQMSEAVLDVVEENAVVAAARTAVAAEKASDEKRREDSTLNVEKVKNYADLHMGGLVLPF